MTIGSVSSGLSSQSVSAEVGVAVQKKALDNQAQIVEKLLEPVKQTSPGGSLSVYA